MGKFALECPKCGSLNTASTFLFAKKVIKCGSCSDEINVSQSRMTTKRCECGQVVVCDQAKFTMNGKKAPKCPACGRAIGAMNATSKHQEVEVICPQCACSIEINRMQTTAQCPICDKEMDVQALLTKEKQLSNSEISVIKYEGDNQTFVWKHPIEDFRLGTQLIVHESQEAIFMLNGQALDTFGPGRHTLETENIPVLGKLYKLPTDRQNPFHAEVYFINQTVQMAIKWGTDERIHFIEPHTGIPLDIGAAGEMSLQVVNSKKLLLKLVGTTGGIAWDSANAEFTKSLQNCFRPMIKTTVRSHLSAAIKEQKINILEIDEKLSSLSESLREHMLPPFEEYGLTVPQFYITYVSLPEDNRDFARIRKLISAAYLDIREAEVEADIIAARRKTEVERQATLTETARLTAEREKLIAGIDADKQRISALADADSLRYMGIAENELLRQKGLAEAEIMQAKGYSQRDVLQADVQKAYAEGLGNIGSGGGTGSSMMSEMLGIGVGLSAAGTVGAQLSDVMRSFTPPPPVSAVHAQPEVSGWQCTCGFSGNIGNFCSGCGKSKAETWDCPLCGTKGITGKFCQECGTQKQEGWECPMCGTKGITGKFCPECGTPKVKEPETWDCAACGTKGITGKFCSECGTRRAAAPETWNCACGNQRISGKFCPECGAKREE